MRIQKEVGNAKLFEDAHRLIVVVFARDRLKDAALIECFNNALDLRLERKLVRSILNQDAIPERIVEIPDDTLGPRGLLLTDRNFFDKVHQSKEQCDRLVEHAGQ